MQLPCTSNMQVLKEVKQWLDGNLKVAKAWLDVKPWLDARETTAITKQVGFNSGTDMVMYMLCCMQGDQPFT